MTGCCQVTTAVDSREAAERLGALLVEARLAACAQITGPIVSIYRWQGRVEHATEWLCLLKTTVSRMPDLEARIRAEHSYQVPEIVAVPIVAGDPAYLAWIEDGVRDTP
ncbi:MAG TPA: divalent-cation tolerance protein CutA [Gemmatimonadales bacterium]|jgi:periplasmic divalent cation tolerance protein